MVAEFTVAEFSGCPVFRCPVYRLPVKLPKRSGKVQSAVCLQHDLQASVGFSHDWNQNKNKKMETEITRQWDLEPRRVGERCRRSTPVCRECRPLDPGTSLDCSPSCRRRSDRHRTSSTSTACRHPVICTMDVTLGESQWPSVSLCCRILQFE